MEVKALLIKYGHLKKREDIWTMKQKYCKTQGTSIEGDSKKTMSVFASWNYLQKIGYSGNTVQLVVMVFKNRICCWVAIGQNINI